MTHHIFEPHQNLAALVKCYWTLEAPKEDTPARNTIVYFVSEDCTTEEARAEAAGGKILRPKMSIGEFGFVSMLMDTEGNTIGLHSRR